MTPCRIVRVRLIWLADCFIYKVSDWTSSWGGQATIFITFFYSSWNITANTLLDRILSHGFSTMVTWSRSREQVRRHGDKAQCCRNVRRHSPWHQQCSCRSRPRSGWSPECDAWCLQREPLIHSTLCQIYLPYFFQNLFLEVVSALTRLSLSSKH